MEKNVWIVAARRTPLGSFQGQFSSLSSTELGRFAIQGVLEKSGLEASQVDEVLMGCVLPAGCGQAPARQAALAAGIPDSVGCTTINKVCGSGMKSVMLAHDLIRADSARAVVAGGMESMTNAPYLQKDARRGARLGHTMLHDHMFLDGLQDAYEGHLMGVYAQQIAEKYDFSREQMDDWAKMSVQRALAAQQQQAFADEVIAVEIENRRGVAVFDHDEHPGEVDLNKISSLKPAFAEDGSVTAASSSAISDGAAALLVMSEEAARHYGFTPLAIIRGHSTHARKPAEFTVAPVDAIRQLLTELAWSVEEVDLWEINEAFAVVTQIAVRELELDVEKVNVHGGACALGHPIGASGARILVTLIHALKQQARQQGESALSRSSTQARSLKGVAALCIGGGEATAMAVEVPL